MKTNKKIGFFRNNLILILIVLFFLPVIAYSFAKIFAGTWDNLANTDFMTLWLAGKSVIMGFDAYDPFEWQYWREFYGATWIFDSRFIFPLPLRLFLAPLGFLSLKSAYIIWTILSIFIIILSIYFLYFRPKDKSHISTLIFVIAGAFLFRPIFAALRFGQVSPWLLLSLVAGIILWEKQKIFLSGMTLAILMLKPTIGGLYILFVLIWLVLKRCWNAIIGLMVGGVSLLILGLLQDPLWVFKFL